MEKEASHFKGKSALEHVIEAQAQGVISSAEVHGHEIPGHIYSAADSAREVALILLLISTILTFLHTSGSLFLAILGIFAVSWTIWKMGRGSWLAWARLERLHRVILEERYEIEHHRQQERDELRELYQAKGFEGKLLEDVLDVLMADNDRLLRVMVQEEMGLSLEEYVHPLKQGFGALIGCLIAVTGFFAGWFFHPFYGAIAGTMLIIGISGVVSAYFQKNKIIPAIIWNISLGLLSYGALYFLLQYTFL